MQKINLKKIYNIGISISVLGIILFLITIATGTKYPSISFKIFTGAVMIFVFLGVAVGFVSRILLFLNAVAEKNWQKAKLIFIKFVIIVAIPVLKIIIYK
jgi:hypothetical protein